MEGDVLFGQFANFSLQDFLLELLYRLPAIFIAFAFHECAHSFVAYKLGDESQRYSGRMTLSPMAHIDLWGLIMIILLGFGWAKPVRVNPRSFKNPRLGMALVSFAGPLTNFILAFLGYGLFVLLAVVWRVNNHIILGVVYSIFSLNVFLMIFNLVPLPPLDGYHIVEGLIKVKPKWMYTIEQYSSYILMFLLISGLGGQIAAIGVNYVMPIITNFYNLFL